MINVAEIEHKLGIHFISKALLETACIHPSYRNEHATITEDNERLEFLGDSVLGLLVSEYLYSLFPTEHEGDLSTAKAALVSIESCCAYAQQLGIDRYLYLGRGEANLGERGKISAYGNLFEAILGALFLDQGLEAAKKITTAVLPSKEKILLLMQGNPKNRLQHYTQKHFKVLPEYQAEIIENNQKKLFYVQVLVQGIVRGEGKALSKKDAEKIAAQQALNYYEYES